MKLTLFGMIAILVVVTAVVLMALAPATSQSKVAGKEL